MRLHLAPALVLAGLGLLLTTSAPADTKTWTGASSTDWFNDLNWSPFGRPAAGDTVILDNGGTMNISAPLGFSGTFLWVRGTIMSTATGLGLATNTLMALSPGNLKILMCPLVNEGTIVLQSSSTLYLDNGFGTARVVNYGRLESQAEDNFLPSGTGGGQIQNQGLFIKTGGTTTTVSSSIPLLNTGTVEATTGTIVISAGTLSGNFIGAGVNHWSGSFTLNGTVNSSNVLINAQLAGTDVKLTGNWTWQTGNLGPGPGQHFTLATNSLLTLIPANLKVLYCPLTNRGTIRLTGGTSLYLDNGYGTARVVNQNLLESTTDDNFLSSGTGGGVVQNEAWLRKSGGAGTTSFSPSVPLVNTGTVDAQTGTLEISAGTLSGNFIGAGINHWAGNFTLVGAVNSSNVLVNANLSGTDVTLTGNWVWRTGNWGGSASHNFTLATNSLLTLLAANSKILYCPLTNRGTIRFTESSTFYLDNGYGAARVANLNLIESTGNDAFQPSGTGGGRVENSALFRKTGGATTTFPASIPLINTGTMEAQAGTIQVAAGTLTGNFIGAGLHSWTGSLLLLGSVNSSNTLINASLYGTNVLLTGNWTWETGLLGPASGNSFSLAPGGVLTLVPGNYKYLYCPLTNRGAMQLTGGTTLYLDHGFGSARLVNLGLVDSAGDGAVTHRGTSGGTFDNQATFRKSGGAGTTTVTSGVQFLNTGIVSVLTGIVNLQNGVLSATFNGPGKTVLTGNHSLVGDLTAQNLELQSGIFSSSSARLHGAITWVTGQFDCQTAGAGATVAGDAVLTLVPGNYKYLYGALTNLGTVRLNGNTGLYLDNAFSNTRLVNLGLVNSTGDDLFAASGTAGGVVDNRGTFRKSGGATTTTVNSGLLFLNTAAGTVNVQVGTLNLQNGNLTGLFTGPGKTVLTGNHSLVGDLTAQNLEMQSGNFSSDSVRLHGAVAWVTGQFFCQTAGAGATVAADGVLTLVPGNYKYFYGALTNLGTVRLTGNTALYLDHGYSNTRLINVGLLDSAGDDLITHSGTAGGTVENRGLLKKSGGASTILGSGLTFLNTAAGTVAVQSGELGCQNGQLSGLIQGPGRTFLTGNNTFNGDLTAENLDLASGNFFATGARWHGAMKWTTGNLFTTAGGQGATVATDCTFTLVPGNYKYLYGTLTNRGAIQLTGNTALYLDNGIGNARLVNHGLVESLGDDLFTHSGTAGGVLENRGWWRKSAGTGSTTFGSGLWYVHGGALEAFKGAFAVNGSTFIQEGGNLNVRLNSDTDYGQIHFTGVAPLGGGLVCEVGPGYSPGIGSQFTVITCGGTNGTFAACGLAPGYTWSVLVTNTFTRLTVTGAATPGAPAIFTHIVQVAPHLFDLSLVVTPNAPYHMEASNEVGPGAAWQYLGPLSSPTSNYVYRHTALGVPPPRQFFRAVSP